MLAGGKVAELERAEPDPDQRSHGMPDRFAHPLDLPLAALVDRELELAVAEPAHPRGGSRPVVEHHAPAQCAQSGVRDGVPETFTR